MSVLPVEVLAVAGPGRGIRGALGIAAPPARATVAGGDIHVVEPEAARSVARQVELASIRGYRRRAIVGRGVDCGSEVHGGAERVVRGWAIRHPEVDSSQTARAVG